MKAPLQTTPIAVLLLCILTLSAVCLANPTVRYTECVSSFQYKGIQYQGCTEADNQGKPWCFLRRPTPEDNWGYCKGTTIPLRVGTFNERQVDCDATSDVGNGTMVHGCFSTSAGSDKNMKCYSSKVKSLISCLAIKPSPAADPTPPKKPLSANPTDTSNTSQVPNEVSKDQNAGNSGSHSTGVSTGVIGGVVGVAVVGMAGLAMFMYRRHQSKKNMSSQMADAGGRGFESAIFEDTKLPPPNMHKTYTVVSTYTPTLGDELEVYPGDQVTILVEYDDGWVQGINESRGRIKGVFPKHCVESSSELTPAIQANI
ncbi:hypothetical protein K493DRAFT_319437 [Basidiobolus meristosporus CBS 931.73]|uniref:SH3 domain-containing protein n=1 Tax=Basidiobolus meristosporus CBS 931.73 TaxID=1314790 RepID=A0A1Y1XRX7_9FUNG|nr:hypothetical protein K493DRAFT_319437 [Basidiobolus meristosporus CBS 931.73]|eukprot:ORX88483.1 hypothetical protein K493DRAFT_319437 [Basidiobolus meristosporus CBS 931.73]